MSSVSLPDEVRAGCAWVAERARFVRIAEGKIEAYAADLASPEAAAPSAPADPEAAAAFAICMNAINFGSGWWPTIRKRPGHSGYATMAAGVEERFADKGPWSVGELLAMDAETISAVVGQDPEHPLMPQFAAALRDVGEHLGAEHAGRYLGLAESAESIPALAGSIAAWSPSSSEPSWRRRTCTAPASPTPRGGAADRLRRQPRPARPPRRRGTRARP